MEAEEITTYPEMNEKIIGHLKFQGSNVCLYAAARIMELETEIKNQKTTTNILTEQSKHSISNCLKELKWSRPAEAQSPLFHFIVCSRQFPSTELQSKHKKKKLKFFKDGERGLYLLTLKI